MSKYDEIIEVTKHDEIEEVEKFNPYHDSRGRFASASGAASFTVFTNSKAGQKAIANIKAKQKETIASSGSKASKEKKPKNQEQIDRVKKFEEDLISELKRSIKPEFRDEFNTVHDLLNNKDMERDINRVKTSVANNDKQEMEELRNQFIQQSKEYAQPWYDEDLDIMRSGWEWESNFYKKLADLCEQKP